ncbi:MAG: hypothetical protein IH986_09895 [Planctomycetes bacterium]|nr:hypothetical protein [Planctomycetota bacterium]
MIINTRLIQPLTRELAHIPEVGCGRGDGLVALARLGHACMVLALVPGMDLRTFMGKMMALDDIFLFGLKPRARARPT